MSDYLMPSSNWSLVIRQALVLTLNRYSGLLYLTFPIAIDKSILLHERKTTGGSPWI
jgi:hypothetical protein